MIHVADPPRARFMPIGEVPAGWFVRLGKPSSDPDIARRTPSAQARLFVLSPDRDRLVEQDGLEGTYWVSNPMVCRLVEYVWACPHRFEPKDVEVHP